MLFDLSIAIFKNYFNFSLSILTFQNHPVLSAQLE